MLATETFSIIDNHCNIKQKPPEVTHHDLSDRRYQYPHRHRQAQQQIFSRAEAADARRLHRRAWRFRTALAGDILKVKVMLMAVDVDVSCMAIQRRMREEHADTLQRHRHGVDDESKACIHVVRG